MCECLCGNIKEDVLLQIGAVTICVDAYSGCRECSPLVGIDVRAFNEQGRAEWIDGTPKEVTPDEYGVVPTAASFEMFSIEDLGKAADELGLKKSLRHYATAADWFHDHGLDLIHRAFAMCDKRRSEDRNG
jgi:hypothetical protein